MLAVQTFKTVQKQSLPLPQFEQKFAFGCTDDESTAKHVAKAGPNAVCPYMT